MNDKDFSLRACSGAAIAAARASFPFGGSLSPEMLSEAGRFSRQKF
jgi:hypothetical protein